VWARDLAQGRATGARVRCRVRPPVCLRLEVGDDGRGPPVGDCGRADAGMGGWATGKSWAQRARGKRVDARVGRCWARTAGCG
jgi:hypothetical protein